MYSVHEYLRRAASFLTIIILVASRWQGCGSGWGSPESGNAGREKPDPTLEKHPEPDPQPYKKDTETKPGSAALPLITNSGLMRLFQVQCY